MKPRKIIKIDEDKCDGCGECVTACAEGAIHIINGKAKLVSETYCDGLGACLGECPQDAISMEERMAEEFSHETVQEHLNQMEKQKPVNGSVEKPAASFSCPGTRMHTFHSVEMPSTFPETTDSPSFLGNWPIQLHLVPTQAPYFQGAKLLLSADCVPFAYSGFHQRFLAGRTLLIGCPKLDNTETYLHKLSQIFSMNDIESIEVLYMEVPCCFGLVHTVKQALEQAEKPIPLHLSMISIQGKVCETCKN